MGFIKLRIILSRGTFCLLDVAAIQRALEVQPGADPTAMSEAAAFQVGDVGASGCPETHMKPHQ